jgi:hypothetical protein
VQTKPLEGLGLGNLHPRRRVEESREEVLGEMAHTQVEARVTEEGALHRFRLQTVVVVAVDY